LARRTTAERTADPVDATTRLRYAVERLAHRDTLTPPAHPADAIGAEITRRPPDACLTVSGSLHVFCAGAQDVPQTLQEIGRLRETAKLISPKGRHKI
jgi:hypothetical protein